MINPSNRAGTMGMIQEANRNYARLSKGLEELHIHMRTYQRWISKGDVKIDQCPYCAEANTNK